MQNGKFGSWNRKETRVYEKSEQKSDFEILSREKNSERLKQAHSRRAFLKGLGVAGVRFHWRLSRRGRPDNIRTSSRILTHRYSTSRIVATRRSTNVSVRRRTITRSRLRLILTTETRRRTHLESRISPRALPTTRLARSTREFTRVTRRQ